MDPKAKKATIEPHLLQRFNVIQKVGSGAYGHVWKVEEKATLKTYALKKIFDAFQNETDAQRTYRQVDVLRQIAHPNVIKLHEVIRANNQQDLYLLFDFMEADLHTVIQGKILSENHIRCIIYQIAKVLHYLHSRSVIHRDLKPSNVLVNSNCGVKLCDFGLVRTVSSQDEQGQLTERVATRWYRSPELLLGSRSYSSPVDIWSFGCILYEMFQQKPIFPGASTFDQIQKIYSFIGTVSSQDLQSLQSELAQSVLGEIKPNPNPVSLRSIPDAFIDLLKGMLSFNPKKRLTAAQIMQHQALSHFYRSQDLQISEGPIKVNLKETVQLSPEEYRRFILDHASNTSTTSTQPPNTISLSSIAKSLKAPVKSPLAGQGLSFSEKKISRTSHSLSMPNEQGPKISTHSSTDNMHRMLTQSFGESGSKVTVTKPTYTVKEANSFKAPIGLGSNYASMHKISIQQRKQQASKLNGESNASQTTHQDAQTNSSSKDSTIPKPTSPVPVDKVYPSSGITICQVPSSSLHSASSSYQFQPPYKAAVNNPSFISETPQHAHPGYVGSGISRSDPVYQRGAYQSGLQHKPNTNSNPQLRYVPVDWRNNSHTTYVSQFSTVQGSMPYPRQPHVVQQMQKPYQSGLVKSSKNIKNSNTVGDETNE